MRVSRAAQHLHLSKPAACPQGGNRRQAICDHREETRGPAYGGRINGWGGRRCGSPPPRSLRDTHTHLRKGTRSARSLQRARNCVTPQQWTALDGAIDGNRFRRLGAPAHPGLRRLRDGRYQLREKIRPRPPDVGTRAGRRVADNDGDESGAHVLRFLFRNGTPPLWSGTQTPCRELSRKRRAAPR